MVLLLKDTRCVRSHARVRHVDPLLARRGMRHLREYGVLTRRCLDVSGRNVSIIHDHWHMLVKEVGVRHVHTLTQVHQLIISPSRERVAVVCCAWKRVKQT